jgi:amino acid adenylation domain-containing protein/non-ribosomal peptide synthase protein (TIGR01720 family)
MPFTCILIGEGALLIECAQVLLERQHSILLIASDDSAVAQWACSRHIQVIPSSGDIVFAAAQRPCDVLFSIVNYAVLPNDLLKLPRRVAINYHDSPLPRYAGLHATSWAIAAREQSYAITWHAMGPQIDGGEIYVQQEVEITPFDTAFSLNGKCYASAIEAFERLVDTLGMRGLEGTPQDLSQRTYDRPQAACLLDWNKTAAELDALVRALDFGVYPNPLGLAKMLCGQQCVVISKATASESSSPAAPGIVVHLDEEVIRIATASGDLSIRQVLSGDGVVIPIADLWRQCGLRVGVQLPTLSAEISGCLSEGNRQICRHEQFWLKRLIEVQPYVLPWHRRVRTGSCGEAAFYRMTLPPDVVQFFRSLSTEWAELANAAFCVFLAKTADVSVCDIGLRATHRCSHLEEADRIFSTHIPLRIEVDRTKSVRDVLEAMRDVIRSTRSHLTYSRDIVVRYPQLRTVAALRVANKFPVVLETAESLPARFSSPGLELAVTIVPSTGECQWLYDSGVLASDTIERAAGQFCTFLRAIRASPDDHVGKLSLVTAAERRQMLQGSEGVEAHASNRDVALDGSTTLHGLFEAQVARRPQALALTCESQSLTYEQLNARANRLAHQLVQLGVCPDMLVGVYLDRSADLVIAILAVLKAGGAYLPIDQSYPSDRIAFMLEDSQAAVLLTHSSLIRNLPFTEAKVLCVDSTSSLPVDPGQENNLPRTSAVDHLAYVIYTSGTTGNPKGSLITHRNVARLFLATEHWYKFNEHDVWTLFHSCAFDFSVWEIWGALLYGSRVVVVPFLVSRSPEAFYELLAREKVTVLNQTPSAFRQLIQAEESVGQKDLALRYVVFGGEALEMQSLRPWFECHGDRQPQLVNMYGITETTVHVTYRPISQDDLNSGSVIGVPIPDLQVYILDAQREPVPIGVPGEMYVGGAGLARGYLRRPELTEQRFVPDHLTGRPGSRLYRTGDLARFLPGRDIEYLGRIDDQVKIRGFRIELGEIESVLCQYPAVREAVVVAREDVPGSKRLVGYLVASQPAPEVSALREHLKKKLPEYMVPAVFVFLEKLPLTNNGKVDQKALPEPEEQRPELAARYVAPRTPAEEKLAEIWSKVLRLEQVGVNDNFFELGGDSILSIQIISLARRAGLQLTPKLLFTNQTIAELAAVAGIADQAQPSGEAAIGDLPLTPIQHWFFEQNLAEPHHYNQAFLLEVRERLERPLLDQALQALSRHHDALRLRFVRRVEGWRQSYAEEEAAVPLSSKSLAGLEENERDRRLDEEAASAQASLDLENGPIWRAVYFEMGSDLPDRLLLVIHHLAVDGVSWRPLLEDLETAYRQLQSGQGVQLPARTASYKTWANRLEDFTRGAALQSELPYWRSVAIPSSTVDSANNTEGSTNTWIVSLTPQETQSLLQRVPAAYNTQINDVLLTALVRAWSRSSGSRSLCTNLEGHGRENLFEDVDLSRTVGWFTSIFPVSLELPESGNAWQPGEALKSIKEQLRRIPQRGIGYGILRYLGRDSDLRGRPEPPIVFNYLGQFDQVLAESKLFRFARESSGPWHSPKQHRRHALELNSLIVDGRLELWWTYSRNLHGAEAIHRLSDELLAALHTIIAHCQSPQAGGRTPSDYPLAGLDQPALDRLVGSRRGIEDIYPLAPIQTLFLSANPGTVLSAFDHWQCTLRGPLGVTAFQRAWYETLRRHSILRSTIHTAGLREPVQMVHRDIEPRWTVEDWREFPTAQHADRWSAFLKRDRSQPLSPIEAPVMRFALVRLADHAWKFLWSVPALLLDGWSWPIVFRDASRLYEAISQGVALQLEAVRPYRDYIEWLGRQSSGEACNFWRNELSGFREPTPLSTETPQWDGTGDRYIPHAVEFSEESTRGLQATARTLQITLSTLVQGAWAMLLRRQSGHADVVFGAAFAGRPSDLRGVESIAGPFVNNLPVRVVEDGSSTAGGFLRRLHARLLEIHPYQFTPLTEIQNSSEVPWRYRLFDSLVVFQNYLVDESARGLGTRIGIADFSDPIHTNYPVLLLAEPKTRLRLTLIYDRHTVSSTAIERWGNDLSILLEQLPIFLEQRIGTLEKLLSPPGAAAAPMWQKLRGRSQNYVPPQTEMERCIAGVWEKMFGLERIGIEENFFDLGGHSLLLVQMHERLQATLKAEFPVVALFEHPTVRSLARHLNQPDLVPENGKQWQDLAQRQKQAIAQLRVKLKK